MPSPRGVAVERNAPTSDPACGSVRFIVPVHSPVASLGKYSACCSGEPWCISDSIAPTVNVGASAKPIFAVPSVSSTAAASTNGMPWPPKASGDPIVPQPPATYD